jgi:S-adenosylmethionine hydrolase
MKGVILSLHPQARIIDLTHEIEPQNVRQAAFVLEAAYRFFPQGSIFVSVVDPGVGSERKIIAAKTPQGIFLAPDNGLLTSLLIDTPLEVRSVTNARFFLEKVSSTFHGRDCFSPAAARLAMDPGRFKELGPRLKEWKEILRNSAIQRGKRVQGEIVYFDRFGSAFSNISKNLLPPGKVGKHWKVRLHGRSLGSLRKSYFEVKPGAAVPVWSSNGILEVAVNQGSARKLLRLKEGMRIDVSS